ncbi:alpha/beta hydrolase [Hoyosella sp. YIM 151337]|uniref:alpha/beta hydrolase n=1 Tax=Hoyosella sp. YIM 151337 TaxID=2992742 RepID=UPI0022355E2E|nr:alpha/beta hydrolase [Hoyosella sp. YIM 151337]MCW4353913.1 alpha/beta hydrolase [Hoyosella sp. YIM 151337]
MELVSVSVGDAEYEVRCDGDHRSGAVLIIGSAGTAAEEYGDLCARLHNSGLRTITLPYRPGMDYKAALAAVDAAKAAWVHVAGHKEGAEVAWQFAARHFNRVSSLVVLGGGHPAAATAHAPASDTDCPAVEVGTTIIATDAAELTQAKASGPFVRGDLRIVSANANGGNDASAIVATEVVLRSNPW